MEFGTKDWVRENEMRSAYLEYLYKLDGRDNPSHPMWGLCTGLYQERAKILLLADRQEKLASIAK